MIRANSLFAAYEIALTSVEVARLNNLASTGHRGAVAALRMKKNMPGSLAAVHLGITLVGAVAAATGGASAAGVIEPALQKWGFPPGPSEGVRLS